MNDNKTNRLIMRMMFGYDKQMALLMVHHKLGM
jgi:hypothetical protein